MSKKPALTGFTVEGYGEFPFDMLRYDSCWPKSEGHDSYALGNRDQRRVVLQTWSERGPTVGRWESFTWRVIGLGELRDTTKYPTPPRHT